MPNIKSAEKRMRTSRKRAERNRSYRSRLRTAVKKVRAATSPEEGNQALCEAGAMLDRAAARNIIHANKAARTKSRLAKAVAQLEAV